MILIFKSVDKTLVYDHSNESYCAVLSLQVNAVKAIFFSPFKFKLSIDALWIGGDSNSIFQLII